MDGDGPCAMVSTFINGLGPRSGCGHARCPHPSRRAHSCLAAMHQEDEDMEEGQTSIATPTTEPAVEAPTGPTPTTDTAQGAAEDLG